MKTKNEVQGNLLLELEEMEKVDVKMEEDTTYSYTYEFGGLFSIICC